MHTNLHLQTTRDLFHRQPDRQTIPEKPLVILDSPLMKRGGFDIFSGIADEYIVNSLLAESFARREVITESLVTAADTEEIRGGAPRRKFLSGTGGEFQREFYHSDWLIKFLRDLTTPFLKPTGTHGTYSHYSRIGDYLEIHRDIAQCDVAVITCLENSSGADANGGQLCLYPSRTDDLLSDIKTTPDKGALKFTLEVGQTIVFYGGIVPHALLPVGENQRRIVSVLCYEAF